MAVGWLSEEVGFVVREDALSFALAAACEGFAPVKTWANVGALGEFAGAAAVCACEKDAALDALAVSRAVVAFSIDRPMAIAQTANPQPIAQRTGIPRNHPEGR